MFSFIKNLLLMFLISGIAAITCWFLFFYISNPFINKEEMTYNKGFTFHFVIMIFLFIVPAIPSLIKRSFGKDEDKYK